MAFAIALFPCRLYPRGWRGCDAHFPASLSASSGQVLWLRAIRPREVGCCGRRLLSPVTHALSPPPSSASAATVRRWEVFTLFGLTSPRQHPPSSGNSAPLCSSLWGLHPSKAWRCGVHDPGLDPQPVDRAWWVDAPATCPSGVQFQEAVWTRLWRSRWN